MGMLQTGGKMVNIKIALISGCFSQMIPGPQCFSPFPPDYRLPVQALEMLGLLSIHWPQKSSEIQKPCGKKSGRKPQNTENQLGNHGQRWEYVENPWTKNKLQLGTAPPDFPPHIPGFWCWCEVPSEPQWFSDGLSGDFGKPPLNVGGNPPHFIHQWDIFLQGTDLAKPQSAASLLKFGPSKQGETLKLVSFPHDFAKRAAKRFRSDLFGLNCYLQSEIKNYSNYLLWVLQTRPVARWNYENEWEMRMPWLKERSTYKI